MYYDIWGLSIYPFCFSYNHFENNDRYYNIIQKFIDNLLNGQGKRIDKTSKGDRIYEGPLKELTGDKAITARALYKDVVTFAPQFKLVTCTNVMPEIVSADDGTRRRFVKIDFISKFTDNPQNNNPDMPYQFKIDKRLDEKFKTSEELKAFFTKYKDLSFFFGKDDDEYIRAD